MIPALTTALFLSLALLCLVTLLYAVVNRPVDNLVLGVTGLAAVVLLVPPLEPLRGMSFDGWRRAIV